MYKVLVNLLRWGIPLGIVAYLLYDAAQQDALYQLWNGPKDWRLLGLAFLFFLAAQLVAIVRWYWLVRSLDIPFTWNAALRLGILGYLLTFISLGAVGGDLLRAFFVAREQPTRRAAAAATVIVDRILGLYSLFLVATVAILFTNTWDKSTSLGLDVLCQSVFACLGIGTVCLLLVMSGVGARLESQVERIPRIGKIIRPMFLAVEAYRRNWKAVFLSILLGIGAQFLLACTIRTTALAILTDPPSLVDHLIIVPLAMLTAILPLPGQGLGAFEWVLEMLYRKISGTTTGQGLLVAFGYRLITIATALVSAIVYVGNRKEVAEVMREAEAETEGLPH